MQNEFDYKKYLLLIARSKRLFTFVALAVMTVAVAAAYLMPKKYEAKSTVFIEKNVISELVKGIAVTPSMEQAIKVLTYAITSRTLLQKVVDDLDMAAGAKSDQERENILKQVQKNIDVKVKDNNLFIVTYTDSNPRIARDFVNTLVRRYVEENVSSKREESYGAIKFLSEQMGTFKEKLDQAEGELNRFKTEKGGVISIDEGRLFEEINQAQQKLYDIQLRRRHLEGLKPVTRKAGDPLQTKLVALQKHLEELRSEYTDSYPEVLRTRSEIETLREQMKSRKNGVDAVTDPQEMEKAEAELQALKISEEGLKRHIATNQTLMNSIPAAKVGMEKLELEKKNRKEIYDQLMARQGQSEVSKQMEVQDKTTNFRIVDPAVLPVKPASPNRLKIMMMGIAGGLAAGLGIVLLLDQMDNSVKSADFLKEFKAPLLAIIPRIPDPQEIEIRRRQTRRLFSVAGVYLLFLLCFPLMEVLGLNYMDRLLDAVNPSGIVQDVKDRLR